MLCQTHQSVGAPGLGVVSSAVSVIRLAGSDSLLSEWRRVDDSPTAWPRIYTGYRSRGSSRSPPLGPLGNRSGPDLLPATTPAPLVAQGCTLLRPIRSLGRGERFGQADRLCTRNLDAKVGLGYVALRQGRLSSSDSLFGLVIRADSSNADAWDGLTLAAWRSGDRVKAMIYGRRAIKLRSKESSPLEMSWTPLIRTGIVRRREPRSGHPGFSWSSRTKGDGFQILSRGNLAPVLHQGRESWCSSARQVSIRVSHGLSDLLLDGWTPSRRCMRTRCGSIPFCLRRFYRAPQRLESLTSQAGAVADPWSLDRTPAPSRFRGFHLKAGFRQEMESSGRSASRIQPHPGPARDTRPAATTRMYRAGCWPTSSAGSGSRSQSRSSMQATRTSRLQGQFLETGPCSCRGRLDGGAVRLPAGYEQRGVQRPETNRIRLTGPSLDPLYHVTESGRAGKSGPGGMRWDDPSVGSEGVLRTDAIGLDAMLVRPTAANPRGWFASYHAYPCLSRFHDRRPGLTTPRNPTRDVPTTSAICGT